MLWAFIRRGGYLAIILIFMSMVAFWVWWSEGAVGRDFANAERLTGTVSHLETTRRLGQNSTYVTTYYVNVIYPGGVERTDVSGRFYNSLAQGDQIEIRRLPGPPVRIEVEPGSTSSNALAALAIGAILLLAGGALAWFIPKSLARARDLQALGRPAEGEIIGQQNSALAKRLQVRFAIDGQAEQVVVLNTPHLKDFGDINTGARHPLRYDPKNPQEAQFQAMLDWLWPAR